MHNIATGQPWRSRPRQDDSGTTLPSSVKRRIGLTVAALVSAFLIQPVASAATYYQSANQYSGGSWSNLTAWNTVSDGSGTAPASITPADEYIANRRDWFLRTPTTASTWPGGPLTIGPANLTLVTKSGPALITVPTLNLLGEGRLKAGDNTASLRIDTLVHNAPQGLLQTHDSNNSVLTASFGTVTGTGDFGLYYYRTTGLIKLTMEDATSYQGTLTQGNGFLEFQNPLSSAGDIVLPYPAKVTLNHGVTFTGATVNGAALGLGVHTAAALGFTGAGTLTVRAPATWQLAANQSGSQDWTGAWASQWNVNSAGSGAVAPSVNIADSYIVSGSGRLLRTPATTSTFGGGKLTITGSGTLQLVGGDTAISTVPKLVTTGGAITTDSGGRRNFSVDTWDLASGTTTVGVGSGAQLNLFVYDFKGAGNLAISTNSGTVVPFLHHGNGYTGTITVNSGATVNFTETFGIAGAMNVSATANVTVADWLYVTGLTVGGINKPLGTYTAASLGWSGPGSVTVYQRATSAPVPHAGVNIAGADFTPHTFWQTNPATWDYFHDKGVVLVRMPFKWEKVQGSVNAPVDFTNLDACIALARDRGMKVILDLHNYNEYKGNVVGSTAVPHAAVANLWSQIAEHYKDEEAVYGYDLMNEPKHAFSDWEIAAQLSVDAIRKHDTTHYVLVEGMNYSAANYWSVSSPTSGTLDIKDPAGRLIYSAHSYWDTKSNPYASPAYYGNDGNYRSDDVPTPDIGINHIAPFVEWLKTRPYAHGNIGEYAIPNNYHQAGWEEAMDNFLTYARANNISTTYWAGGNNWTASSTVIQPQPLGSADKPQMAVLELHLNLDAPPTEVIVDNLDATLVGTWVSNTHVSGYYGTDYHHDNNTGKGTKTAQFTPNLTAAGSYEVFIRWTSGWNRATNAPVTITHAGGTASATVNQQQNNNTWVSVGTYDFAAGTAGSVTLGTTGTNGHVIADAVRFTPANGTPPPPTADPALVVNYDFSAGDTIAPKNGWGFSNPNWPMGQLPGGGGNAMPFTFGAEPAGEDGWSEHRFAMPPADEFWIRLRLHVPANYHHRVDTYLEIANAYAAGWRVGDIVRGRDGTSQAAISRITSTVVYLRSAPKSYNNDVWVGQLTNLTRSTTLNCTLRRREAANNKLLAIWCDDYSSHGIGSTIVWQTDHWTDGTENSVLTVGYSVGNNTVTGGVVDGGILLRPADRGTYMDIIFHGKFATSPTANNGIIRSWVRKEGQSDYVRFHNITNANIKKPTTLPAAEQFWKRGYLMGWSNSGFDQTTTIHLSKIEYYNAMPAVLAPQ